MTSPLPQIDHLTDDQLVELQRACYIEHNKRHWRHIMSGDCWCDPETEYEDPRSGVKVIVHKRPQ